MTDLRPRLPRDRDGIAIDAMGIGETYAVWFGETYPTHQIGPFESNVVVRISTDVITDAWLGTSAADLATFIAHSPAIYGTFPNVFHIGTDSTERVHLPAGETLHLKRPNGRVSVTIMK